MGRNERYQGVEQGRHKSPVSAAPHRTEPYRLPRAMKDPAGAAVRQKYGVIRRAAFQNP
jgi:hypothetical protein